MNRSDVFISYRRIDKEFAKRLDDAFKGQGFEVWVDWEDIPPGVPDFTVEIQEGIEGADVFVPVLSPSYLESPYCMGELDMAIEYHKRIVPLVYQKFDVDQLPSEVQAINWVYFCPHVGEENEFEDAFPVLMEAIQSDYDHLAAHTRYFLRAKEWDKSDRNRSLLLHGSEVDEAEQWLATAGEKNPTPVGLHTEYIFASRAHQRSQQRRLLLGVTAAFIVSIALTILSVFLARQARIEEMAAQTARAAEANAREIAVNRQLEARSLLWSNYAIQAVAENDTRLAIPLALAANQIEEIEPPPFSQQALAAAAYAPGPRRVFQIEEGRVWTVDYSPDEQQVIVGTSTGELMMWDIGDPSAPLWTIDAHEGSIWDVNYSPQGNMVVSSGADGRVLMWDPTSQELVREFRYQDRESDSIWSLTIDPTGRYIAAGGVEGHVYVWELNTGDMVVPPLDAQNEQIWTVEYSPQGRHLAAGGSDGNIIVWNGRTFSEPRTFNHGSDVWSLAFNLEGSALLSGGDDGRIIRWDVGSGAQSSRSYRGHSDRVLDVEIDISGDFILGSSADGSIILWNTNTGQEIRRFEGHTGIVWDIAIARRERRFISASADGSVILWDIDGGAELQTFTPNVGGITTARFTPDGTQIVFGTENFDIIKRDIEGGSDIRFQPQHADSISHVAFSPDGQTMLSAGDNRIFAWDAVFGGRRAQITGHEDKVRVVVYASDQPYIYSAGSDNTIIRWDNESFERDELIFAQEHSATIWDIAVNPVRNEIASASSDRSVIIWDTETGEPVENGIKEYHSDIVRAVSYSPSGTMLASGGDDTVLVLYNTETGATERFTGHGASIHAVQFSPNGQNIVSGDANGVVIIWDLDGNPLRYYDSHEDIVTAVAFEPNGEPLVLSSSLDGTVILWRADNLQQLIDWTVTNRDIRALTCLEQEQFQVDSEACAAASADDDSTAEVPPIEVTEEAQANSDL